MRYQLMGRRKVLKATPTPNYPGAHLHSLPPEILNEIVGFIPSKQDLIHLGQTCRKLHQVVSRAVYRELTLTPTKFYAFGIGHLPLSRRGAPRESSRCTNAVKSVHVVNPPIQNKTNSTKIAGSYDIETLDRSADSYQDFVHVFRCLLSESFSIQHITLSEISPTFALPVDAPPSGLFRRSPKTPRRRLARLTLKAQSGWTIPVKSQHLSLFLQYFDIIEHLELVNFIIDDGFDLAQCSNRVVVHKVTFCSCRYSVKKKRALGVFTHCSDVVLDKVMSPQDLSLIDYVLMSAESRLTTLEMDMDSPIFYSFVGGTKTFNFPKFNPFFRLVCSKQGRYANVRHAILYNFDLAMCLEQVTASSAYAGADEWVVDDSGLSGFLRDLAEVPKLTMKIKSSKVCVKCGHKDDENKNWHNLLRHLKSTDLTIIGPDNKPVRI
ncbi:hypothetical protein DICA3_E05820 [Diutina catenulata]